MDPKEAAQSTIDALTFRLLVCALATRPAVPAIDMAAELLTAIKAKEAELGIGIRVEE